MRPRRVHRQPWPRNAGAGAPLLAEAESTARSLGLREVGFEALNEPLAAYYGALGYARAGPPYVEPGWGRLIPMRKELRRSPDAPGIAGAGPLP